MEAAVEKDGKTYQVAKNGLYSDENDVLYYMDGDGDMHLLPVKEEDEMELPTGLEGKVPDDIRELAAMVPDGVMLVHYVRKPAPKDRIRTVVANLSGKSDVVLCMGDPNACLVAISVAEITAAVADHPLTACIAASDLPLDGVIVGWSKHCDSAELPSLQGAELLELASKLILEPIDHSERIETFEAAMMENLRKMATPRETAPFHKGSARYMALVRALVDKTDVVDGVPVSKITGAPLPRGVAKALPGFVARARRYYKDKTVSNVSGV